MASTILAVGLVSAASAATLSGVSGPVLVDSGKGFVKVSANAEVAPGNRVMISKGGKAVLAYADGCSKALGQNTVTTVVASGACTASAQVAGQAGVVAGGAGLGTAAGGTSVAVALGVGAAVAVGVGVGIGAAAASESSANGVVPVPPPISR
ncbi:MAG TPA: hypothetical protein VNX29_10075 [Kaistia sp.]|nr:hypothetical protein [Kaistia sp.]